MRRIMEHEYSVVPFQNSSIVNPNLDKHTHLLHHRLNQNNPNRLLSRRTFIQSEPIEHNEIQNLQKANYYDPHNTQRIMDQMNNRISKIESNNNNRLVKIESEIQKLNENMKNAISQFTILTSYLKSLGHLQSISSQIPVTPSVESVSHGIQDNNQASSSNTSQQVLPIVSSNDTYYDNGENNDLASDNTNLVTSSSYYPPVADNQEYSNEQYSLLAIPITGENLQTTNDSQHTLVYDTLQTNNITSAAYAAATQEMEENQNDVSLDVCNSNEEENVSYETNVQHEISALQFRSCLQ